MDKPKFNIKNIWSRLARDQQRKLKDICKCHGLSNGKVYNKVYIDDDNKLRCKRCKKLILD